MMFATNESWTITDDDEAREAVAAASNVKHDDPIAALGDSDEAFETLIASYHKR